jgi:hypothetical protein
MYTKKKKKKKKKTVTDSEHGIVIYNTELRSIDTLSNIMYNLIYISKIQYVHNSITN